MRWYREWRRRRAARRALVQAEAMRKFVAFQESIDRAVANHSAMQIMLAWEVYHTPSRTFEPSDS